MVGMVKAELDAEKPDAEDLVDAIFAVLDERDASANTPPDTAPTDNAPACFRSDPHRCCIWPEGTQ